MIPVHVMRFESAKLTEKCVYDESGVLSSNKFLLLKRVFVTRFIKMANELKIEGMSRTKFMSTIITDINSRK